MFDFGADARAEGGENGQNHKGLMTIDRKYKKDAFYAYKAWLSDEPFVHMCGKRYIDRVEDVTKVTVYSNQPKVELFVNGKSMGEKTAEDHFFRFDVPNVGESTLEAVAGECRDESMIRKVDKMNEDYILILAKKMGAAEKKPKNKKKKNAAASMDSGTMNLISGLTVLRFTSMLGMRNVYFTKEELLKLNKQLNKISK